MDDVKDNSIDTDLDWLAFQYVTGELPGVEREAFEAQLANDQSAREAVAAAVQLSAASSAAFAAPRIVHLTGQPRSPGKRTAQRLTVLVAAVAACIAIAWLGQFRGGGSGPSLADRDANDRDASRVGSESLWGDRARRVQQLALVWADLNEQLSPDELPPRDVGSDSSEFNSQVANGGVNDDDVELDAPDWLIAALDDEATTDGNSDEG